MSDINYRTPGPWGAATVGADLTANQVDTNFWILYSLILALQDATPDTISYFTVTGTQMWITMTDHYVFGPFTIPTAVFNFRGAWAPNNAYAVNDIFTANGAVYMVIYPQLNSGATFYDLANDSLGHNFYGLLLAAAPSALPSNGQPGQFLQWTTLGSPGGVAWAFIKRPIGIYIEEPPNPMEVICRYKFVEKTQFPVGLAGSVGGAQTWGTGTQQYELYQNGANIGSIDYNESPTDTATFTFPALVTFMPNDVLTIVAPTVPDPHMTGICFTLVGDVVL
jgi:hypothetical protein